MDRTTGREAYRAARDILLRHRDDYHGAVAAFRWPAIGERFNWALDWFDSMAVGNPRMALRIIDEDGSDRSYSFAAMAATSVFRGCVCQSASRRDPSADNQKPSVTTTVTAIAGADNRLASRLLFTSFQRPASVMR